MIEYIVILAIGVVTVVAFTKGSAHHNYAITEPAPGQYRFFYEKGGVTVYLSWIASTNGKTSSAKFKLINNNDHAVKVVWSAPQWYSKGIYLCTAGKDSDDSLHQKEFFTTEISQARPNYLYFDVPKGGWKPDQLTIKFSNFSVLTQNQAVAIA